MMRVASPERTRKPSWSASQWYIAIGSPGPRTKRLTPTCASSSRTSWVTWPRGPQSRHSASRTLRTYQSLFMRRTLRAKAVEDDVEIALPLAFRRARQRGADEHLDVGRLDVPSHRTGGLRARHDLRAEL